MVSEIQMDEIDMVEDIEKSDEGMIRRSPCSPLLVKSTRNQ